MGLPQVIVSHQMMRHDGGDTMKSQAHHAGLRALPLKAMECGKVSPRQLWRGLSHLSAYSRYTTIGDAGERCVLEVSPLQLVVMCTASNYLLAIVSILW